MKMCELKTTRKRVRWMEAGKPEQKEVEFPAFSSDPVALSARDLPFHEAAQRSLPRHSARCYFRGRPRASPRSSRRRNSRNPKRAMRLPRAQKRRKLRAAVRRQGRLAVPDLRAAPFLSLNDFWGAGRCQR